MIDAQTLRACGATPLSPEDPAGGNVRYEAEFTAMEAELEKLTSLHGGELDWSLVRSRAVTILSTTSKDFLVGAYLAHALHVEEGLPGLQAGLQLLQELVEHWWEQMQPPVKRLPARRSAVAWFAERSAPLIAASSLATAAEHQLAEACQQQAASLHELLIARLDDPDSGLGHVLRALRDALQLASSSPTDEAATDSAAATVIPGGSAMPTQTATPAAAGGSGPVVNRQDALKRLDLLIEYFKKTEPHSPIAPLLQRARRWGDMGFKEVVGDLLARDNDVRKRLYENLGLGDE